MKPMMKNQHSGVIAVPVEWVFDFAANYENDPKRRSEIRQMRYPSARLGDQRNVDGNEERRPQLYGMNAYLMIAHEVEKARLADQARKDRQNEELSPTGSPAVRDRQVHPRTDPKEVTTCRS